MQKGESESQERGENGVGVLGGGRAAARGQSTGVGGCRSGVLLIETERER